MVVRSSFVGGVFIYFEGLRRILFCARIVGGEGREGVELRGSCVSELFLSLVLRLLGEFFGAGEFRFRLECGFFLRME